MKILAMFQTIDLGVHAGCTPAFSQLFKALHGLGNEVVIIPDEGRDIDSLWWRSYKSIFDTESRLLNRIGSLIDRVLGQKTSDEDEVENEHNPIIRKSSRKVIDGIHHYKLQKRLFEILEIEGDVDVLIVEAASIINIMGNLPALIKKRFDIPIIAYDGDFPWSLPYYNSGAGISDFDAFVTNSGGGPTELKKFGAKNVFTLHYGVDPEVYSPVEVEQDIDVFFYGLGSTHRQSWINRMLVNPSIALPHVKFALGGRGFDIELGNVAYLGDIPFSSWRHYCCRSKINLNITRQTHARLYTTSSSRPFELASLGCCVVSNPYKGLEEWFELNKEIFIARDEEEAIELYRQLLESDEDRRRAGELARKRVLAEHTYMHRAQQLLSIIEKVR